MKYFPEKEISKTFAGVDAIKNLVKIWLWNNHLYGFMITTTKQVFNTKCKYKKKKKFDSSVNRKSLMRSIPFSGITESQLLELIHY